MTNAAAKTRISAEQIARMTKYYGTIEAAREAYRVAREAIRSAIRDAGHKIGRNILVLEWDGRIVAVNGNHAFAISSSPKGPDVLPIVD